MRIPGFWMPSSIFLCALCILAADPAYPQSQGWIGLAYRLSSPGTNVRHEPYLVSDRSGHVFAFWQQDSTRPCCSNGQSSLLRVARFDGTAWSDPLDISTVVNGRVEAVAVHLDSSEKIHLIWFQREPALNLYYSSSSAEGALTRQNWQGPRRLQINQPGTDGLQLRVDASGVLHLLSKKSQGLFYTRSADQGGQWTTPVQLDSDKPQGYTPNVFRMELDGQGGLHAVWDHLDSNFIGRRLQYVRSTDGGANWSAPLTLDQFDPVTDNVLTQSVGAPYGFVVQGNSLHLVWVGGAPGAPTGVGRKHRISPDLGQTWGPTAGSILNALWGLQNGDGLAVAPGGRISWVGLARNRVSQGALWEGLWGAYWEAGTWSTPQPIVTVLPPGADSSRLASTTDGKLVAAFRNQPSPEALYATHTAGPQFFFPHYADGDGWSMQLAINNLSANRARGKMVILDRDGRPQELPFEGGLTHTIDLDLAPNATAAFRTSGLSAPIRTGFIRVELDQTAISGIAIFQNANGTEASVLPSQYGRRYAFLAERSSLLQTGVAFVRHTPDQPITLKLYDTSGSLLETKTYTGSPQAARFVNEFFPEKVVVGFRGLLVLESDAAFSSVGLRFGDGVLSTIPAIDLDAVRTSGVFYFPHYGDGDALSMLIAINNLSTSVAAGKLTILDQSGLPQEIPLAGGPSSQVPISLPPTATSILQSSGTSKPARTGFIKVELDRRETSGVAIFKYTDGREASVLPTYPGKKFALYVERSANFDTGLAVSRTAKDPVLLNLYDDKGTLLGTREFLFDKGDSQRARFLTEVFSLPAEFRGLLLLQSTGDFATIGLRFGRNVLSTIPVAPVP